MQEIFLFLKQPSYNEDFRKFDIKIFLSLALIYFISVIPIGIILFFVSKLLDYQHKISFLTFEEKILYVLLLAPIIEEVFFRLIYIFTRRNLIILIVTTLGLLMFYIIKKNLISIILFSSLTLIYLIGFFYFQKYKDFFICHFKFWFYFIAVIFAILHIFNFFGITISNIIFAPLFVIPQLILGIILGYIRVTYGFIYTVFFHMVINSTILFQL